MRILALVAAFCVTTSLSACAQPGPGGPEYAQNAPPPGYGQDGPPPGYGQGAPPPGGPGAPPAYGQQGWAGGMQSGAGAMQAPPPGEQPPGAPGLGRPHMDMAARFAAANTTRDGRLTPDQAQAAGLVGISRHFQQIDADHKGYVTMQDIKMWRRTMRAQKMGQAGAPPPNGAYPPPLPPQGQQSSGQQY